VFCSLAPNHPWYRSGPRMILHIPVQNLRGDGFVFLKITQGKAKASRGMAQYGKLKKQGNIFLT